VAAMRAHQIVPVALLVLFAAALFVAIAFVQMGRNAANQEYMDAQARFDTLRKTVDGKFLEDFDQEGFAARLRHIDEEEEKAEAKRQAALDRAAFWQNGIFLGGVVMFVVFVAVTIYTGRKAAAEST
jgi:NADH:ubiquinone oxidoreductase subunit 6 (subunit J)